MSSVLLHLTVIILATSHVASPVSAESGDESTEDVPGNDDMMPPSDWTQYNWRNQFDFSLPFNSRAKFIQRDVGNNGDEGGMVEGGGEDNSQVGQTTFQDQENTTAYWEIINSTFADFTSASGTEVLQRHAKVAAAPITRQSNESIPLDGGSEEDDEEDTANIREASRPNTEMPTAPTTPTTTGAHIRRKSTRSLSERKDCGPKLDLVFLLDTSGSIQQIHQEHVKWAVALIDSLPVAKDFVRVAAIQYAGFPLTEFALGTYPDARDIREHLMKINFQSGITRTAYALRKAEAELFLSDRGARGDARKAAVLFTDGLSIDDPSKPAEQLRTVKGVSIYVVNLSSDGFEQEIDRIAGSRSNVFGPGELNRLRETILSELEESRGCQPARNSFTASDPSYSPQALSARPLTSSPPPSTTPATSTSGSPRVDASQVSTPATVPPTLATTDKMTNVATATSASPSSTSTATSAKQIVQASFSSNSTAHEGEFTTSTLAPQTDDAAIVAKAEEDYEDEEVQPTSTTVNGTFESTHNENIAEINAGLTTPPTSPTTTPTAPTTTIATTTTTAQESVKATTLSTSSTSSPVSSTTTLASGGRSIPHTRVRHLPERTQLLRLVAASKPRSAGIGTIREFPIMLRDGNAIANKSAIFLSSSDTTGQEHGADRTHTSTPSPFPTLVSLSPAVESTAHPSTLRVVSNSRQHAGTKGTPTGIGLRRVVRPSSLRPFEAVNNFRLRAAPTRKVDNEEEMCPIDWLFMIDSSGSVQGVYQDQKRYLEDILEQIHLGSKAHRVALLQFAGSDIQKTEWNYDTHNSSEALMKAFSRVRLITGTTYIGKALESALHILNSRRREVPSIAVLFSDGFSQDDASQQAEKLRRMLNLDFYSISMSELSNIEYLTELVGTEDHVFAGERRAELKELLINRILCQHR